MVNELGIKYIVTTNDIYISVSHCDQSIGVSKIGERPYVLFTMGGLNSRLVVLDNVVLAYGTDKFPDRIGTIHHFVRHISPSYINDIPVIDEVV